MTDLANKVAVVTGASRPDGIGRSTAHALARLGAKIVVSARPFAMGSASAGSAPPDWRGIDSVAQEIVDAGGEAVAIPCDVSVPEQVEALFRQTAQTFGRLDILVNNAGASGAESIQPIVDLDDAAWRQALDCNLTGTFLATKYGARLMIDQGDGGAIVNVSSLAGRQGYANFGGYCAAKFGLIGLTQQTALELAVHRIRVNCVCPGATDTGMLQDVMHKSTARRNVPMESVREGVARKVPLGRIGGPDELAAAISFLATDAASYVTGQTLNVDGGSRMD